MQRRNEDTETPKSAMNDFTHAANTTPHTTSEVDNADYCTQKYLRFGFPNRLTSMHACIKLRCLYKFSFFPATHAYFPLQTLVSPYANTYHFPAAASRYSLPFAIWSTVRGIPLRVSPSAGWLMAAPIVNLALRRPCKIHIFKVMAAIFKQNNVSGGKNKLKFTVFCHVCFSKQTFYPLLFHRQKYHMCMNFSADWQLRDRVCAVSAARYVARALLARYHN